MAKSSGSSRKSASARSTRGASRPSASTPRAAAGSTAAPAETAEPVIVVPNGSRLEILVDVSEMTVPYSVSYADRTVVKSLVDEVRPVRPLETGRRTLAWVFMHVPAEGWSHTIAYSIDGGEPVVLESMSAANKDPDTRIGIAFVDA